MIKPELQAKFLQHLNKKKKGDEGFTLIELLVVVIIIGVLAAIALPSLLGQVNKAKQSEAKNNIGAINRSQQAFFLEYNNFASSLIELQAGVKGQTDNYDYSVVETAGSTIVQNKAVARKPALRSYYGMVGTLLSQAGSNEALSFAIACESTQAVQAVADITTAVGATACATNFTTLAR